MEFQEVMARRQSCRVYADRPVEREKLAACLEAGRMAPSGCNAQRWTLIGVDDRALCADIANTLMDHELNLNLFAGQIPAYIVIVSHRARRLTPTQEKIMSTVDHSLIDIGIAAQQICLTATDLGLGSLMMGWFDRKVLTGLLGIPAGQEPVLVIGIGHPKNDEIRTKRRYPAAEIIRWNGYQKQGE